MKPEVRWSVALCGAAAFALAQVLVAQQPQPPFKAGVDYVVVEARVLDANGNPVRDVAKQNLCKEHPTRREIPED